MGCAASGNMKMKANRLLVIKTGTAPILNYRYVFRLQTLRPLLHFELHLCAFIQASVPVRLDGGKVNEDVLPAGALNESETL